MFIKYPHIERLGNDDVIDITVGKCYVFPKIDGTQSSVWMEDGQLMAGSRRRQLAIGDDNAGFYHHILNSDLTPILTKLLTVHPDWHLYGEWLVPHSLKTYRDEAWRNFYIFDVYNTIAQNFFDYNCYSSVLEQYNIAYIPALEVVTNPTEEHLTKLLEANTYLLKDSMGVGEGIIIKRYDFVNQYGRTTWAKIVRNEFKEQNKLVFGHAEVDMMPLELKITQQFVTIGRIIKIKDKMREDGPVVSRRIPELLGKVWHDVIVDEMWNILKKHKGVTINFRALQQHVIKQVKEYSPELFGK